MNIPKRKRFPFPSEIEGIPHDWKRFLNLQFDDLYPDIQPLTSEIVGLVGGEVIGTAQRQCRQWIVSISVTGTSAATSSYVDLPFSVFADTNFTVQIDGLITGAYVLKNTNRLMLPDWSTTSRVIISGTAGE